MYSAMRMPVSALSVCMRVCTASFDLIYLTRPLFVCRYVLRAYNAISAQENGVLDLLQPTDSAPESMEGRGAFTFRDWQHPYYMMLARELQLQDLQDRKGGSSRSSSRLREGEESVILERSLLRGRARLDRALIAHQYYAHRLIKKGEELLTAYGRKSNSELIGKTRRFSFTLSLPLLSTVHLNMHSHFPKQSR